MDSRSSRAISGLLWMLTGSGSERALQLIILLILARILAPEDFAAVALIMALLAIAATITEMGLSVAIVQRPDVTQPLLDSAFFLTLVFFLSVSLIFFLSAGRFADFYKMPILIPLTRIAATAFFFQGLKSFYRSLLLRDERFKSISIIEIVSVCINGFTATTLAVQGYGAYSIVWGLLFANIVAFFIFSAIRRFVPNSFGSIKLMKELLSFGAWVSAGRILGSTAGQFDRLLIGKILSERDLGGYHIATRLTMAVPGLLTNLIDQVLLPIYSASKNDTAIIERGYWKGLKYSIIFIVPISLMIAIYAKPLVFTILGEDWIYIVPIIQIVSIFSVCQGMGGGIFASAIYASGLPKLTSIISLFRIIALPSCVIAGSHWGITGVAWGVAVYGIMGRIFNQWLLKSYLGYRFSAFFRIIAHPICANLCLLVFGIICQLFISLDNPVRTGIFTLACIAISTVFYGFICRFLMPVESRFLFNHFVKRIKCAFYFDIRT